MKQVFVFFGTGFEEVEALTVVDLLRRAGIDTKMISINENMEVTGSHNITVKMDMKFEDIEQFEIEKVDMLVLPGGLPGTTNLNKHKGLLELIEIFNNNNKYIGAICAAPTILGGLGLLKNKKATCYPSFQNDIEAMEYLNEQVVVSENIITSAGMGTSIPFGLKIIEILLDEGTASKMASTIVYS